MPLGAARVPQASGRVVAVAATPPAPGDRPWWGPAISVLAVVPGVLAVLTLWMVQRAHRITASLTKSIVQAPFGGSSSSSSKAKKRRRGPSPLFAAGAGGALGYQLGKRWRPKEHSLIRVAGPGGDVYCRCASAPGSLPLSAGDDVFVWGRAHADGTVRVDRLENGTTGAKHRAQAFGSWVPVAAAISVVLVIAALASVLNFHA